MLEIEAEIPDEHAPAQADREVLDGDHDVAQPGRGRDNDLRILLALQFLLASGGLEALDAAAALGAAGFGTALDPLELATNEGQAPLLLRLGARFPFRLALQVAGVVAVVGMQPAPGQLDDTGGDPVQEAPVVRDEQHRARIRSQVGFEPLDGLGVHVVGGLVEHEQIRLTDERLAEVDPAPLAAGQRPADPVAGRRRQAGCEQREPLLQVPGIGGVQGCVDLRGFGGIVRECVEPCQ